MVYVRQIWADEDPDRPVSAARMNYIEEGLEAVAGEVASVGASVIAAEAAAEAAEGFAAQTERGIPWTGTAAQYAALPTTDPLRLYLVVG